MESLFYLAYGVAAGLALGLTGGAIGIIAVRQRFGRRVPAMRNRDSAG